MDQRELVERASQGDKDAFGLLVVASIAHLESVGRLILRDQELARDAVQETYLRAWRDLPGLRDPDRFDAWLHRLIVNACLDVLRRRKRRVIEVELPPGDSPSTVDETRGVVDRDQLERCFQRLRPESRSVLVLHYYVGLSTGAIADTLGIPLGTAQSRLHRSRNELRAAISADDRAPATIQEGGQPA